MKKIAILTLLLFLGCKRHSVVQKENSNILTDIKKDSTYSLNSSKIDSNVSALLGKTIEYNETTIENPVIKTRSDDAIQTIALKGSWSVKNTDEGLEATNTNDTLKKAVFDSLNDKLTIINGNKKKVYSNILEISGTKLTNKSLKIIDTSKYQNNYKKVDSLLSARVTKDSTAHAQITLSHKETDTKITPLNWLFIGLGALLLLGGLYFIFKKVK